MFTRAQRILILKVSGVLLFLSLCLPLLFHTDVLTAQTQTNGYFENTVPSMPLRLHEDSFGRIHGYTTGGELVRQSKIVETDNYFLRRVEIDGTFFYISDRGMISADSDTIALSIYHSLAT